LKVNRSFKEHIASIFRVEEQAKQETSMKHVASSPQATSSSETSAEFQRTLRHCIPEIELFITTAYRCENYYMFAFRTECSVQHSVLCERGLKLKGGGVTSRTISNFIVFVCLLSGSRTFCLRKFMTSFAYKIPCINNGK
jgi:hypothetical protein